MCRTIILAPVMLASCTAPAAFTSGGPVAAAMSKWSEFASFGRGRCSGSLKSKAFCPTAKDLPSKRQEMVTSLLSFDLGVRE
jgi:hypothetical protein